MRIDAWRVALLLAGTMALAAAPASAQPETVSDSEEEDFLRELGIEAGEDEPDPEAAPTPAGEPPEEELADDAAPPEDDLDFSEDVTEPVEEPLKRRGVEEILVTAERRAVSVQDLPMAISAFNSEDLERYGATGFEQLSFQIPNLSFGTTREGGAQITIRGIGGLSGDSAVSYHEDGVYYARSQSVNVPFVDAGRVEVLRGPQGTLYGRNSTAGTINVISRPASDELEVLGDFQYGAYEQLLARAALNVPIVPERLHTRVSYFSEFRTGFQENFFPGSTTIFLTQPAASDDDYADDAWIIATRGQLRFLPTDDIDLTLRGNFLTRQGNGIGYNILPREPPPPTIGDAIDCPPGVGTNPIPDDPRQTCLNDLPRRDHKSYGGNGTLSWDFYDVPLLGNIEWRTLGSWQRNDLFDSFDQDLSSTPLVFTDFTDDADQWTIESELISGGDGPFEWIVGFFGFNEDLQNGQAAFVSATRTVTFAREWFVQSTSWAGFTQLEYSLFEDELKLILGFRYNYDRKQSTLSINPNGPIDLLYGAVDESWTAPTGRFATEWSWGESQMAYFSLSRGYKPGFVQNGLPIREDTVDCAGLTPEECGVLELDSIDPEFIWAYEIGSKNRFFDDRLELNVTGFFYDYTDFQIEQLVGDFSRRENAKRARTFGAEIEAVAEPFTDLLINLNFSYLNAKFLDFCSVDDAGPDQFVPDPGCPFLSSEGLPDGITLKQPVNLAGNTIPRSPRFKVNLGLQYTIDMGRFGLLTPRWNFTWTSLITYRVFETGVQPAYTRNDVRLGWTDAQQRFFVEGFVTNIENEDVKGSVFIGTSLLQSPEQFILYPPRQWGARAGFRF